MMKKRLHQLSILLFTLAIILTSITPSGYAQASTTANNKAVVYSEYYTLMDGVGVPTFLVGDSEALALDTLSQLNYTVKIDNAKKTIWVENNPNARLVKPSIQPLSFMMEPKKRGTVLGQATLSKNKVLIANVPITAYEIKGKTVIFINDLFLLGKTINMDKVNRTIVIGNGEKTTTRPPLSSQELFFSGYTIKDFERLFGKAKDIKDAYGQTTASFYFGEVSINASSVTVSIDSDQAKGKKVPTIIRNIDILDPMDAVFAKFPKISSDSYKVGSQEGDVIYWTKDSAMRRFTISDKGFTVLFGVGDENKLDEIFIRMDRTFTKANDGKVAVESGGRKPH